MQSVTEPDQSIVGRIARALASRIIRGELAPGARLRQHDVAEEFGASHVPVREAFRLLEAQGLVSNRPRCGVSVSQLDPGAVSEVSEMRANLEGLAFRHALPKLGEADLDAAQRALLDGESGTQIADLEVANRRFHLALTSPCGMPRLMAAIGELHQVDARFLFATWKHLDWQARSDKEHRAILEAVRRGDGERAVALLEAHIRAAGKALAERLRLANEHSASAA